MPVIRLTSWVEGLQQYPDLADFSQLTDVALRKKQDTEAGLYLAESHLVISRALDAGHTMRAVLIPEKYVSEDDAVVQAASSHGVPVYTAPDHELEGLTGYHLHRGAIAAMHRPTLPSIAEVLEGATRVVVLDELSDHTNVGAIFRACAGLGMDAVLVTDRCADPLYRRSIRVSMGTVFQVPWTKGGSWSELREAFNRAGFTTAALALREDSIDLRTYSASPPEKVAVVFGPEGPGLSDDVISTVDDVVRIPMAGGVDSLNVAAAAAVTLWALWKVPT